MFPVLVQNTINICNVTVSPGKAEKQATLHALALFCSIVARLEAHFLKMIVLLLVIEKQQLSWDKSKYLMKCF